MATDKKDNKKYIAEILFTREHLDQKIVAKRVGVSERTMSKWVNDGKWKNLRKRMLITKSQQISDMYEELEMLNTKVKGLPDKFADNKLSDVRVKLTASIRNLETDLAIGDLVESGIRFIKHLQQANSIEKVMEVADLWNNFIQASIKK